MVDVIELLRYNREIRHRYLETLSGLPWEELAKDRGASFESIRNIFVHCLECIHYWLNFLLKQNIGETDYSLSMNQIRDYMEQVEARMESYLANLSPRSLQEKYRSKNDMGVIVEVTTEDVLIHLFEEEVHHRGEIIALLWQMGVEPPPMGWKSL